MTAATYRAAGVDLTAAAGVSETIKRLCAATHTPQVLNIPGFFAGAFRQPSDGDTLLVASTDSVGTKVRVAQAARSYASLGADLVNHCVNDILTTGATPLFFLDYIGAGKVDREQIVGLVEGLAAACKSAGCALIGGETATLAGVYQGDDFDLVGFIVGAVKRQDALAPGKVHPGDILVGVPSSGLHTNGFSLVRAVFGIDDDPAVLEETPPELERSLGEALLAPHRCYLDALRPVLGRINCMAHITGGGLLENVPRALPPGLAARIDLGSWRTPPLFDLIEARGRVDRSEMFHVFNMGVGMVLVVDPNLVNGVLDAVPGAWRLGRVEPRPDGPRVILT